MAGFFKKALGVFVEFDDDKKSESTPAPAQLPGMTPEISRNPENHAEAEKFEKYFDNLFDKANLPGPDYYEFYKTMEMLEAHIADENARVSATFASLSIQGLTKQKLIDTANKYKDIIEQDHRNFDRALEDKMNSEVGARQSQLQTLNDKIAANSAKIQQLTKEISDAQVQIGQLKNDVLEQQ